MISWDGAQAKSVYDLMDAGHLPHFKALAQEGLRAEWLQPVDPSLTSTAHSVLTSGDLPSLTGIVSDAFHVPGDSFYWYRLALDEPLDRSTRIWKTASELGLTTATVFIPGVSPDDTSSAADFTIGYGVRHAYSRRPSVPLTPAAAWKNAPASFSPPLEGSYDIPDVARLYLLVTDSTDDGLQNYDRVFFSPESSARQILSPGLRTGEWGSIIILPDRHAGANLLVQEITPEEVTFYHSGVYSNTASPQHLTEEINNLFNFFQPGGDFYALQHGWISKEDYLHQLSSASLWRAEVTRWVHSTLQPDLLFTWQDSFDSAGHAFLLQDPSQPGYSQAQASSHHELYLRAALAADEALETMLSEVDLSNTTVLLLSAHGMAPVHTSVNINTLLQQAGLLTLDWRDYVVVNSSRALAVADGGAVHIYINLRDHERGGIVSSRDYPVIQDQIIALLSDLHDPESGEPVFQRILRKDELGPLGLDHPHSGDVYAQAFPGFTLEDERGAKEVFSAAQIYGQHGYASETLEMQTIFIAAGAAIPGSQNETVSRGMIIPPLAFIDLPPTIARLLGFSLPVSAPGQPLPYLLYP